MTCTLAAALVASAGVAWATDPSFDVSAPGAPVVTNRPLTSSTVMQSFAADPLGGRIYFGQVRKASTGDVTITQTDLAGKKVGSMVLNGAGHGWGIGVQNVNGQVWLFTEAEARADAAGKMFGTSIARFRWSSGSTVDLTYRSPSQITVSVFRLPQCVQYVTPSVDAVHNQMGVACLSNAGYRQFFVYPLDQFVTGAANFAAPLAQGPLTHDETDQGWALYGSYEYQIEGDPYSASNPKPGNTVLISRDQVGNVVSRAPSTDAASLTYREPEGVGVLPVNGVPRLSNGFASGSDGNRKANLVAK